MKNNLEFLRYIFSRLQQSGIGCIVFGGWAKELSGTITPRPHKDVDLLYISNDFEKVDAFVKNSPDVKEISAKHFPHKRAFLCKGVMLELLLVIQKDKKFVTNFWDEYELEWPPITTTRIASPDKQELLICGPLVVDYYHAHEQEIAEVRDRHIPPH